MEMNYNPNTMTQPTEAEKMAMLREMNENVRKIKKYAKFFYVLALIGLIACAAGGVITGIVLAAIELF